MIKRELWKVCLLVTLCTSALAAQNTGSISGYVIDLSSEEPLIGATVIADSTSYGAITDLDGFFTIGNIPVGSYNITASYIGYRPVSRFNVLIKSVSNADLRFELDEGLNLDEILVRPDPYVKEKESPLSIQKLTTEEIIAYPGGNNDIAKVVQSFPGVSGSIAGFRNDIIIRGGAPNEVVYYLDGIEIPNINHFATQGSGGGPVSLLNVSFFDGVSLNTSAFSAQYDNALSGVLQFNQRNGNNREQRRNVRISASETALTLEGPLFKKDQERARTSYIVSARRSYLQFLFKAIGLPFLPDYWDFQLKVNHKIDDYNELTIIGLGAIDDFSLNIPDSISQDQRRILDGLPVIQQWSNTMGLSWRHRFKNKDGFLRNSLSYNVLSNDFRNYADNENETGLYFSNDASETEVKWRGEMTQYENNWKISTGLMAQYALYSNQTADGNNNVNYSADLDFMKFGLFAQVSKNLFEERLSFSGGVRFDGNTFTDSGKEIWKTFSPRMALSLKLDADAYWRLNASVGRYHKLPAYTILGFKNNANEFANQGSEYIRSDHYVGGIEFIPRPSTRINIEAFWKNYANYPISLADSVSLGNLGGGFEVFGNEGIRSEGKGRAKGIEFSLQQKLTKNWFALLSYTYYKSEYTGFDTENYLPSVWDNRHLISFTGGYKLGRNWELGAKLRYNGGAPFAPLDVDASTAVFPELVFDYSNLGEQRLTGFSSLDIRVDKKWNFAKWTFNVYLDLQNVYGATPPAAPSYLIARDENDNIIEPRTLQLVNSLDSGSLLPSLGLIFDF